MSKKYLKLVPALLVLLLAACGTKPTPVPTPTSSSEQESTSPSSESSSSEKESSSESSSSESQKQEFTNVFFDSATYTYDGASHILAEVRGAPENTTITYQGREPRTEVGVYEAWATLNKEGYNEKALSAKLTINPAEFSGLTYESKTITYDGSDHIGDVSLVGTLPDGTTKTETIKNENGEDVTSAINAGVYSYNVVLRKNNYLTASLNATLTINKANITGVSFNSETITYDGSSHTLTVTGNLPAGANVQYTNNGPYTDAGVYQMKAVISATNYNNLTLNATLTINKANYIGITFNDAEFEYDGNPHTIAIVGTLPSTSSVAYTSDVDGVTNTATDPGEYNVTATITDKNFNTLVLNAKMTIKTEDDERYLKWSGDTLFFQNAIHDNLLYAYNEADDKLMKASGDNAVDIIEYQDDSVMFVSKSLISSSIKTAAYDASKQSVDLSSIHSARARYVQYGGGHIIYYVVNGLTQAKSGIYKADLSGEEPIVTCLSVGKAKYLTLVGSQLYFADGGNDYKLSYISTSGENQTRTLLVDKKIKNLYYNNGNFFYTVNNLLGDYIERYNTSNGARKLTSDAGIDFCFIDGYLYYINVDKLNTKIWGEGIYKVSTSPIADNNNAGTKVIENEKGLCSLITDGEYLYYYDMDGYKLIKASIDGDIVCDLLEGFVRPEDPTPTSLGGDLEEYNGLLYYLDIWDEKSLHYYNPQTKANVRLTANKVDNFSIIGDFIYLNMVSYLVNNDTYRFNLKVGGEPEKINTNDGVDFVSDGTYLYYAQDNGAGAKTAIRRTNLDTMADEEVYNKGVSNLRMINNALYFIDGYQIFSMNLSTLVTTEVKPNNKSVHTTVFDTDGTNIYYREMYSVGYALKRLSKYNISSNTYTAMATDKTDPVNIVYHDGYVYYYTDTTTAADNGLYRVSATSTSTSQGTCVLACNSTYYATTFAFVGSNIYFLNYKTGGLFGDSRIYELPISGGEPVKVA